MRQVVVSLQMAHLTENELPRLKTKVKALSEEVQELKTDISQARYVIELKLLQGILFAWNVRKPAL